MNNNPSAPSSPYAEQGGDRSTQSEKIYSDLHVANIPGSAYERLAESLRTLSAPSFVYPWEGLEAEIRSSRKNKLYLVGYGSLLNPMSAARTIANTPLTGHPPVLALGAKRVFNYVIPAQRLVSYGGNYPANECAALNVQYTKSRFDAMNGRVMELAVGDLEGLRKREYGYDLNPVTCQYWGAWEEEPFTAYVLVATEPMRGNRRVLDDSALPHPLYTRLCRAGAQMVSEDFLAFYLRSTFLADGKTSLEKFEHLRPELSQQPKAG